MHPNASTYAPWVQKWLTADRLGTYLQAAGNNSQRAFNLYQWNTAVNAALLHDFAHTEVALRNALHRELSALVQPALSWIAEPTTQVLFPVTTTTNNKTGVVYDANEWIRGRLKESRKKFKCSETVSRLSDIKEGRIVADLTFGVWVEVLAPRFEETLWTSGLRKAFSPGISRDDIYKRLRLLNDVRNRLAHHEPNLAKANAAHRELFWILRVLDSDVRTHVKSHSTVANLLASKP